MDPRNNPYAPGAGAPPPELAGREEYLERAAVALDRIRAGRSARSFIFYGLRGVGKTVLLNRVRLDAESRGLTCTYVETPEDRSLPALLAPHLRSALIRVSKGQAIRAKVQRAWQGLASFARGMKLKYNDVELSVDYEPEKGLADSGDLEFDLTDLLITVGEAARESNTAIALFVDELQYVEEEELAALITALHRTTQEQLPITVVAAGLPQLIGQTGRAKLYAERLFEFVQIDSLDDTAATRALRAPALKEGVEYENGAISEILQQTKGYPYFLQEWGKHTWNIADGSPIELADARAATETVLADLDASFFRVRFDRLTPSEKRYMRAMAELGAGPHRSGDVAALLGKSVTAVGVIRSSLIRKGMAYSPSHGDTAFTVPLFDGFMKRIMPKLELH